MSIDWKTGREVPDGPEVPVPPFPRVQLVDRQVYLRDLRDFAEARYGHRMGPWEERLGGDESACYCATCGEGLFVEQVGLLHDDAFRRGMAGKYPCGTKRIYLGYDHPHRDGAQTRATADAYPGLIIAHDAATTLYVQTTGGCACLPREMQGTFLHLSDLSAECCPAWQPENWYPGRAVQLKDIRESIETVRHSDVFHDQYADIRFSPEDDWERRRECDEAWLPVTLETYTGDEVMAVLVWENCD